MHSPGHDPVIVSHTMAERHSVADANRLAALARGRRTRRRSLVERIGGRLASITAAIRHQPVRREKAPTTRS